MGILLNGRTFTLSIPEDKRVRAINSLNNLVVKKKATVKELQQLTGFLNFLHKTIFTGRAFTRRMYAKFKNIIDPPTGERRVLKPYHHVKLDAEFKTDCRVWIHFLEADSIMNVARPYVDLNDECELTQLEFFSDASLNCEFGFGARFNRQWTYGQWPEGFVKKYNPSIELLELFGLTVAVFIWAPQLANLRAVVFCDNEAVVHMINNSTTSCPLCIRLIRGIVLRGLLYNFRIFARHVRSQDNEITDSLSRLNFKKFNRLKKQLKLRAVPEPIPECLWPITQLWNTDYFFPK